MTDRAFEIVRERLLSLELADVEAEHVRPESSLIDDLGLDSLKFVDLTVALEEALEVEEFPMQDWVDRQMDAGLPLTVEALAAVCRALLQHAPAATGAYVQDG